MKKLNFDNKWVIIIGATGGLGREICLYLRNTSCCKFILCDINKTNLTTFAEELKISHQVDIFIADITMKSQRIALFEKFTKDRQVYAVLYASGINFFGRAHSDRIDHSTAMIEINFTAPAHLLMLFNEYFKKSNIPGGIMIINSLVAKAYFPYQSMYSASKIALDRYIRAYTYENKKSPIAISQVYPGSIDTPMTSKSPIFPYLSAPLRKLITPAHVVAKQAMLGFTSKRHYIYMKQFSSLFLRVVAYVSEDFIAKIVGKTYQKIVAKIGLG